MTAATPLPASSPDPAPSAAPSATSSPSASEGVAQAAESIRETIASESGGAASLIDTLDSHAIQIGSTHVSLWSALLIVLTIVGVWLIGRYGSRLARKVLERMTALDPTQLLLADKLVTIAVWTLAILIGIDLIGVDLTALTVFSGALGLAAGFGLQKTFGNLIAGIILLMDRSIKPGDVISVSDMAGRESFGQIRKIGIRAISVVTRDRTEYLIPNENLMINQVVNWSYSSRDVRIAAPVTLAFDTDIDLAERLMLQAVGEAARVVPEPEPKVLLMGLGERGFDFEIRFWIVDPEEGINSVRSDVLKRAWALFREHGITVPFPQRDLNFGNSEQFERLVAALERQEDRP